MENWWPDFFKHPPTLGVGTIFKNAVKKPESHTRLAKEMIKLYVRDKIGYTCEMKQCLAQFFCNSDKMPGYDNILDFSTKVCILHEQTFGEEDPFIDDIFQFLFDYHDRKNVNVRLNSCVFISKLLNGMGNQAVLDESIFEKIGNAMLERLQDKCPNVRAQAVIALHRLQDPYDLECTIVKTFIFHMEFDPSPIVREKVVEHIAVASHTLPIIVARIKDTNESVKKAVFKTLSKLKVIRFTIAQRQSILTYGLNCKQEEIRDYVIEQLLIVWYKQYDCNMLKLYEVLFVENFDEDTLKTITFELFKKQSSSSLIELMKDYLNVDKVVFMDKLTPEVVTFWYYLVIYLSSSKIQGENYDEDIVFEILPTLSRFTEFISLVSKMYNSELIQNRYMMGMLLKIASEYSLSDENGRNKLKSLCMHMLCKESELSYVPKLSRLIQKIVPNVKERCSLLCEIIQDIREPADEEINQLEEAISNLQCNLDTEIELKKDPETLIKCLTITFEFLLASDITELHPSLLSLKDHFIMPCLNERNTHILNLVQKILTQMCIRNVDFSMQVLFHFCLQAYVPNTCSSALDGLFDILVVHGLNLYNAEEEEEQPPEPKQGTLTINDLAHDPTLQKSVKLVSLLVSFIEISDVNVKVQVYIGLAKLLLASRIDSPLVLARLTLAWFNTDFTDKNVIVRTSLGIFFSLFAFKRPKGREVILGSFVPTLKAIEDAKEPDPNAQIDPNAVSKLLVHLLRDKEDSVQNEPVEGGSYHYRLALIICEELKKGEIDRWVLIKSLTHVVLQLYDGKNAPILLKHLEIILNSNQLKKDKRTYKMLQNFHSNVIQLQKSYEENVENGDIDGPSTKKGTSKKNTKRQTRKNVQKSHDTPVEPVSDPTYEIQEIENFRTSPLVIESSDDDDDGEKIENKSPTNESNQSTDSEPTIYETPPKKQKILGTSESSEEENEDSIIQVKASKNQKRHKIVSGSSSNEDERMTPAKQVKIDEIDFSMTQDSFEETEESEDSFVPPSMKKNPSKNAPKTDPRPSINFRTRAQKRNNNKK